MRKAFVPVSCPREECQAHVSRQRLAAGRVARLKRPCSPSSTRVGSGSGEGVLLFLLSQTLDLPHSPPGRWSVRRAWDWQARGRDGQVKLYLVGRLLTQELFWGEREGSCAVGRPRPGLQPQQARRGAPFMERGKLRPGAGGRSPT